MSKHPIVLFFTLAVLFLSACGDSARVPIIPVDWKKLTEPKGLCQISIPSDYKITEPSKAEDPSGKISVDLNSRQYTQATPDWNTYKTNVKRLSKPVRIIADSATLLYFDSAAANFSSSTFWVAKPEKDIVCSALISAPKADAQRFSSILSPMVASLGTAHSSK